MIVHQQLAALTGKPGSKKKKKHLAKDVVEVEVHDPLFTPNSIPLKKQLSKKPKKAASSKPKPSPVAAAPKKVTPPSK